MILASTVALAKLFDLLHTLPNLQEAPEWSTNQFGTILLPGIVQKRPWRALEKKFWCFADFYWFASRDAGDNCSGVIGHPHQKNPTKYYP